MPTPRPRPHTHTHACTRPSDLTNAHSVALDSEVSLGEQTCACRRVSGLLEAHVFLWDPERGQLGGLEKSAVVHFNQAFVFLSFVRGWLSQFWAESAVSIVGLARPSMLLHSLTIVHIYSMQLPHASFLYPPTSAVNLLWRQSGVAHCWAPHCHPVGIHCIFVEWDGLASWMPRNYLFR